MQADFWHERWQQNQIGLHQAEINTDLRAYWPSLSLPANSSVFVPLCGKSHDLLWLREQGYRVIACELSAQAVQAFFAENGMQATMHEERERDLLVFEASNIRIYCGDFFALQASDLAGISAVYDRAALIALPPTMRCDYANKMLSLMPALTTALLITLDYPQQEMNGPPFSVGPDEVQRLYESGCTVQQLTRRNALEQEPRMRERGLTRLDELVFRLRRF